MKPSDLLAWHYLIFLLPLGVSMLLLGLSALNGMDDNGDDAGEADGDAEGDSDGEADDADGDEDSENGGARATGGGVAGLLGVGKAPLSLTLNSFFIVWGVAGLFANLFLLPGGAASFAQILPSLGIAFLAGAVTARGVAEIAGRVMPKAETKAVSRNALFGLTGRVLFTVTETNGRIRVYDEHGGMHDEPCRIAPGTPEIPKGKTARIVDADAQGRLIVEE